jgi:endonuclease YncB( thermonuclease family)
MVLKGWAVAFRRYSLDYVADEDAAQRGKRGVWSGEFEMPWIGGRGNVPGDAANATRAEVVFRVMVS